MEGTVGSSMVAGVRANQARTRTRAGCARRARRRWAGGGAIHLCMSGGSRDGPGEARSAMLFLDLYYHRKVLPELKLSVQRNRVIVIRHFQKKLGKLPLPDVDHAPVL